MEKVQKKKTADNKPSSESFRTYFLFSLAGEEKPWKLYVKSKQYFLTTAGKSQDKYWTNFYCAE